jgi:hypothetical protein
VVRRVLEVGKNGRQDNVTVGSWQRVTAGVPFRPVPGKKGGTMSEPSDAETFRGGSESRVRTREGTVDVLGHEVARGIGLGMKKGLEGCTYVQYPAREEKP